MFDYRGFWRIFVPLWAVRFLLPIATAFFGRIALVFKPITDSKMLWRYAGSVIARMHHAHSFGDIAVNDKVGNSMGTLNFASVFNRGLSVPRRTARFLPYPTPSFRDVRGVLQEFFQCWQLHTANVHNLTGGVK